MRAYPLSFYVGNEKYGLKFDLKYCCYTSEPYLNISGKKTEGALEIKKSMRNKSMYSPLISSESSYINSQLKESIFFFLCTQ